MAHSRMQRIKIILGRPPVNMQSYAPVTFIWFTFSFAEISLLLKTIIELTKIAYEQEKEVFAIRPPSNAISS
jgi:hypothetical protein